MAVQESGAAVSTRSPDVFSTEEQVLLACARIELSASQREVVGELLRRGVDWDTVWRSCQWHRLSGILFRHLRASEFRGRVPAETLNAYRSVYMINSARHLRDVTELTRVLGVLRDESIPVILLKGAALVRTLYREPGVRPMGDLDLLVPRSRLNDAQAAVQRGGYVPVDDGRDEHWAMHQHLPRLIGGAHPVAIEVHGHVVRLDSPLAFDIEEFWQRAQPLAADGAPCSVLAPEDQLIHLALNFFRDRRYHSRGALGQLCDLSETIRQYPIDWRAVVDRGARYRIGGPFACSLQLARSLMDAPIPDGVVQSLAPRMAARDVDAFARMRVVTTRSWVATELVRPEDEYGGVSLARGILRRIVPTREYMRERYGTAGLDSYWRRLGYAAQVFAQFLQKPAGLTDDLSVDRWVHSLYEPERTRSGSRRRRGTPETREHLA